MKLKIKRRLFYFLRLFLLQIVRLCIYSMVLRDRERNEYISFKNRRCHNERSILKMNNNYTVWACYLIHSYINWDAGWMIPQILKCSPNWASPRNVLSTLSLLVVRKVSLSLFGLAKKKAMLPCLPVLVKTILYPLLKTKYSNLFTAQHFKLLCCCQPLKTFDFIKNVENATDKGVCKHVL